MTEIRKLLGSIKKKVRFKNLLTKRGLQEITVYSFFLWIASLIGFFVIVAFATNFFSGTAVDTPFGRSDTYQVLMIGTIVVGVFAFVTMALFGVLSTIVKGKRMKLVDKKLPFGLTNKRLLFATLFVMWSFGLFLYGRLSGFENAFKIAGEREKELERQLIAERQRPTPTPSPTPAPKPQPEAPKTAPTSSRRVSWGGVELWEAVNKRRIELGVNPLGKRNELCTIAAIRLNELLDLGKLDGHEGFGNMDERRPDLKWIFDKYNISEFLIVGYPTPEETVKGWENTLGHRSLLAGGEYVWGCIYAGSTFAVAITAY